MTTHAFSRRTLLTHGTLGLGGFASFESRAAGAHTPCGDDDAEILGQGRFRYRVRRLWGRLDPLHYPVRDCHGISTDRDGQIVLLTNDTHNNLIAYNKSGSLSRAWEHRFPGAHGLDIVEHDGEDQYWIADHSRKVVSVCTADGTEVLRIGPEALKAKYPDPSKYRPTNTATLPSGEFFISDGYGSSFVHRFDAKGRYVSSFGGVGDGPEHLVTPHAVWIDTRSGKPLLLICDRGHNALKWFSLEGEFLRMIDFGAMMLDDEPIAILPCNVAQFHGRFKDHLAIAGLWGMIVILDGADRVVSAVGGLPPRYIDDKLQPLVIFNYTFGHPHDLCVDETGAIYVAQWASGRTYPIKLEPIGT